MNYSQPGGGPEHEACIWLANVKTDLHWLRDVYRRSKLVLDTCAELGARVAVLEEQWAGLESVEQAKE